MAQQHINLGTPPQGVDGDTDRQAWVKAEANFTDLYAAFGGQSPAEVVAQVEQNTADIATLKPQVATNATNIGALQTNDSTQDGRLTAVESKNTAQDGSIAANTAALANVNFMGGFKNRLINGTFDWWQRGFSAAAYQGASKYLADRWVTTAGFATIAPSAQTFALGTQNVPDGPYYWHRCAVVTGANAGEYALMCQRIENLSMYSNKQMTISFWAKADAAKKMGFELQHTYGTGGSTTDDAAATTSFNLTANWQKFQFTFNTKDMGGKINGPGAALIINFWFTSGTTYATRSGGLPMQSGTFDIAQVKLEFGPNATPFENRPYAAELALCQRYYRKSYDMGVTPGTAVAASIQPNYIQFLGVANNAITIRGDFGPPMRTKPVLTLYDDGGGHHCH